MKKLYPIQFPNESFTSIEPMYFNGKNVTWNSDSIHLHDYGNVIFDTYYNSFSVEKWHTYTNLASLFFHAKLEGKCKIIVYNKQMQAGDFFTTVIKVLHIDSDSEVNVDLSDSLGLKGIIAIEVQSLENDVSLSDMYYCTDDILHDVKLAIAICTFKRETYIKRFIENFTKAEPYLPCIEAFISDNAKTLEASPNPKIHIFKNKNYGGAGGFARCMYEVKKSNEILNAGFTHIVLMDDDIFIDFCIFERMISFLSCLKNEYRLHFLAGAMCSLDMPWLQYEKCSEYNGSSFRQFGANFDLRDKNTVILNDRNEKLGIASAGWWCSCFSVDMITPNNFPFPCFFRGDDVEFTIRNGSRIITLNGLNVWHEPFYKKYSITSESYYLMRNLLVVNALYTPQISWKKACKTIFRRFLKSIFTYDYESAELLIQAMLDFAKGSDFYLSEKYDPEKLNAELMKKNHKLVPIDDLLEQYRIDDINYCCYFKSDRNKAARFLRLLSLNGYLLPSFLINKFSFALIGFGARLLSYFRASRVMVFEPFSKQGYFVEIHKWKAFKLCMKFISTYFSVGGRYQKIKADYQRNFWKMQTQTFWQKFLGVD